MTSARSNPQPDDLLDLTALLNEGLDADEARAVLGPHSALSRAEVEDHLAMLRRECGPMQVAKEMLARPAVAFDAPHIVKGDHP